MEKIGGKLCPVVYAVGSLGMRYLREQRRQERIARRKARLEAAIARWRSAHAPNRGNGQQDGNGNNA
jgi:hypothetical protein